MVTSLLPGLSVGWLVALSVIMSSFTFHSYLIISNKNICIYDLISSSFPNDGITPQFFSLPFFLQLSLSFSSCIAVAYIFQTTYLASYSFRSYLEAGHLYPVGFCGRSSGCTVNRRRWQGCTIFGSGRSNYPVSSGGGGRSSHQNNGDCRRTSAGSSGGQRPVSLAAAGKEIYGNED